MTEIDFTNRKFNDSDRAGKAAWLSKVNAAYKKALNFKPVGEPDFAWRAEQLENLASMKSNNGMMKLVSGPAATGKTTLQEAIMNLFVDLDFNFIYDAPANTNVADYMQRFNRDFPGVPIVCAAPSLADTSLSDDCQNVGMDEPTMDDFKDEIAFNMLASDVKAKDIKQKFALTRKFHIRSRVLATARDKHRQRVDMFLIRSATRRPRRRLQHRSGWHVECG